MPSKNIATRLEWRAMHPFGQGKERHGGMSNLNAAKAEAIQRQGAKGAAVVITSNPLATPDLDGSGFPARGKP